MDKQRILEVKRMLKLDHITKIYQGKVPYQALTEVSFSVKTGEFVSIMGLLVVERQRF